MGTTFERAVTQVPLCNPARTSVLSGLQPSKTGILDNPTPWYERVDPADTLPGVLKAAGAYVAMFGKHFHTEAPIDPAQRARMFDEFIPVNNTGGTSAQVIQDGLRHDQPFATGRYRKASDLEDEHTVDAAVEFLRERAGDLDEPFFLGVGITKPHLNWWVPSAYFDLYDPAAIRAALRTEPAGRLDHSRQRRVFRRAADERALARPSRRSPRTSTSGPTTSTAISPRSAMPTRRSARCSTRSRPTRRSPPTRRSCSGATTATTSATRTSGGSSPTGRKRRRCRSSTSTPTRRAGRRRSRSSASPTSSRPCSLRWASPCRRGSASPATACCRSCGTSTSAGTIPATGRGIAMTTIDGSVSIRAHVPGKGDYRYTRYPDGTEELYDISRDPNEHVNRVNFDTGKGKTAADDAMRTLMSGLMDGQLAQQGYLISDGTRAADRHGRRRDARHHRRPRHQQPRRPRRRRHLPALPQRHDHRGRRRRERPGGDPKRGAASRASSCRSRSRSVKVNRNFTGNDAANRIIGGGPGTS